MYNKEIANTSKIHQPDFQYFVYQRALAALTRDSSSMLYSYLFDNMKMKVVFDELVLSPTFEIKKLEGKGYGVAMLVPIKLWNQIGEQFDEADFNYEDLMFPTQSWMARALFKFIFRHFIMADNYKYEGVFALASDLVVTQKYDKDFVDSNGKVLRTVRKIQKYDLLLSYDKFLEVLKKMKNGGTPVTPPEAGKSISYYYDYLMDLLPKDQVQNRHSDEDDMSDQELQEIMKALESDMKSPEEMEDMNDLLDYISRIKYSMKDVKEVKKDMKDKVQQDMRDLLNNPEMKSALQDMSTSWGDNSLAELQDLHLDELKEPTVSWQEVLANVIGTAGGGDIQRTYATKHVMFHNIPRMRGSRIVPRKNVLVALDTSGSISVRDMQAFFEEIDAVYKRGGVSKLTIIEIDCDICRAINYHNIPKEYSGGGGTNFDSAIEYYNEKSKADILLYFTDGYAPTPKVKPNKLMGWVITEDGSDETVKDLPYSFVIKIERD